MAEYIDREALYEKAYWHGEHPDVGNPFPDGVDAIDIKDVDAIPAADVAPVVRCKDCKYLRVWNQKDLYAFCPKTNFVFLPFQADTRTHFCSLGEPKET